MRILFSASHPPKGDAAFGGVASWIKTLCDELSLHGHECVAWGPGLSVPDGRFDVGVISNAQRTSRVKKRCDRVLGVSHGIIAEEKPSPAIKTLFTSEEVKQYWAGDGNIIRQPIDLRFWNPVGRDPKKLAVFYSYRSATNLHLETDAEALGLSFLRVNNVTHLEARDYMRQASVVFASGRAALEAMACGAPTVILDHRGYNGSALCSDGLDEARRYNYSGRGGFRPRAGDGARLAKVAMAEQKPRKYVEQHHDVAVIATQLLNEIRADG